MELECFKRQQSICWDCKNAVSDGINGCSWSESLKPVKGWVADTGYTRKDGFCVRECPQFKDDKE